MSVAEKIQQKQKSANPLEDYLGYQLRRAAVLSHAELAASLKNLKINPSTAAVMLVLASKNNIIQLDLARSLGLQRTNISPVITNLEQRGFIHRSELDGRSQCLQLTSQGLSQIHLIQSRLEQHTRQCFSLLSEPELENLSEVLKDSLLALDKKLSAADDTVINQQLSYQIQRTSSLVINKLVKALTPLELSPSNASALIIIDKNSGIIQNKLGHTLGIKSANISKLISELKDRKLISIRDKGRAQALSLSLKGQQLAEKIEQTLQRQEQGYFSHLDEVKKSQAIESLKSVRRGLS